MNPKQQPYMMSQGHNVLPPRSGDAYPIPCNEWALLKDKISKIKSSQNHYYTIGWLLIGAALSTMISIFTGSYDVPEGQTPQIHIAWSVVVCCSLLGLGALHFAKECQKIESTKCSDAISLMEAIEERFSHEIVDVDLPTKVQLSETKTDKHLYEPPIAN